MTIFYDSRPPYLGVYENALSIPFCEELMLYFEKNKKGHQRTQLEGIRNFTEMTITDKEQRFLDTLVEAQDRALTRYRVEFNIGGLQFPQSYGYEAFRVKRYLPNTGEQFSKHSDVGNHDSAKRFIAFLWYLNTVERGGETVFFDTHGAVKHTIVPVQASVLIFPPLWTHPHAGLPVVSGPKYVISSYCHYL